MRLLRPVLTLLLLLLFYSGIHAQDRCATVEYQKLNRSIGKIRESDEQFEKALAAKIKARRKNQFSRSGLEGPYKIPVVVHIIHNGEALGVGRNIPDAQIFSQIDVLNQDFNRENADAADTPPVFASVAGDLDIEFVLAKQDPYGNCTDGIVRVNGNREQWSLSREEEFKALSYWPAEDYLNIWVVPFSGYLGYAQFPISSIIPDLEDEEDNRLIDGVVIDYQVFGTVDGAGGPFEIDDQYNKGRTATHEVGHFLGLRHIWGDENNCLGTDYADDTPNQEEETYNTPSHPLADACSAAIMFQNFMDYTDDIKMNLFTLDQIERMSIVLENSPRRASLLTSHGLDQPSQDLIDLELMDIDFPSEIICRNDRQDKTPLVIHIDNVSGSDIDEITYTLTVNHGIAFRSELPITFTGTSGIISITAIPGLVVGDNTVEVSISGGCDLTPANNRAEFQVNLLDNQCEPFVIYAQPDGQTAITFDLSETIFTRVSVINLIGQEVTRIETAQTTNQTIPFSVLSGAYIVRVQIGGNYYVRKVIL